VKSVSSQAAGAITEGVAPVYELDPLQDSRWQEFLERDTRASIFHDPGWLEALRRTYGYVPFVLTTSPPGEPLANGVVFCRVNSRLTGRRIVSLPFSDHCEPLAGACELQTISVFLEERMRAAKLGYVEFRPVTSAPELSAARQSAEFTFHTINLRRSKEELFEALHRTSIRQMVQRAAREGLICKRGIEISLLQDFYRLFTMTRRRHGLPPTPYRWFRNVVECLGNNAQVYVAYKNQSPAAGLFILKHGKKLVYKYGGSNQSMSNLGGTPFLFWKLIEDAKAEGFEELDLGRSDLDNEGLITFKNRLGGHSSPLHYWRLAPKPRHKSAPGWMNRFAKQAMAHSPDAVRIQLGNLLYRHLG